MAEKPLAWNEIRDRAVQFAADWRGETQENAEAQTFWNEWFEVFGIKRRRYVQFERKATRTSTGGRGRIDAFWEGQVAVEHKSAGRSLSDAEEQALDYLNGLDNIVQPRMVITSDFAHFRVLDLEANTVSEFPLADLPQHIGEFGFIAGYESRTYKPEDEVNIKAAEMMGGLYDGLAESGYTGHDLKVFLVRCMFIFFADDTGVWEKGLFSEFLETRTAEDGSDLGPLIDHLFRNLNKREDLRSANLDQTLARFPYVNGGLFEERIEAPDFNRALRARLIICASFDWSAISPAIFGSMFQSVMDSDARRALGAHYTSEQNILKVIGPLFLDGLRAEFDAARNNRRRLEALHSKIASLTFFDPAAGSGNFLIIAYREIRNLEFDILVRLDELDGAGQQHLSIDLISGLSKVDVDQFYAIEIEEFPARIAQTALYLVDHLANMRLSKHFGQYFARIPLRAQAHVHVANALTTDWNEVLPAERCSYLFGNPPFIGRQHRTATQTADQATAMGEHYNGYLDYVTAWYTKAVAYMRPAASHTRAAFVSTNSIVQGEQVAPLWQPILDAGFEVDFAHRTFSWTSEARGKAAVHVIIVGFSKVEPGKTKHLYDYVRVTSEPVVRTVTNINPYLVDAPNVIVRPARKPLVAGIPTAAQGSKPTDGGHLIVEAEDYPDVAADPIAAKYLRRAIGARNLMRGEDRWVLWLTDAEPHDLLASPVLKDRLEAVATTRAASTNARTKSLALRPTQFDVNAQPTSRYICMPRHSSENRRIIPMALFESDVIVLDSAMSVAGADDWLFAVLQSQMFNAWVRSVGGRIKSDMRIAPDLVYNTFPFPDPQASQRDRIIAAAQAVQAARANHPDASLADLYHPLSMPPDVTAAHRALDSAVDASYRRKGFDTEADRLAFLMERHGELLAARAATLPTGK